MKIQCPSCDQRLEIPDELPEQTIECPACNASLSVPSLATPPPSPVQVQQSAPQVTDSEKTKSSSIPKWAIASVASITVVAVGMFVFYSNTEVKTDGNSKISTSAPETIPDAEAAKPEPPTAKAPDISIHRAVEDGNIEAVKQHLAAGTDVNEHDSIQSPLHYAAQSYFKEIAELLIANGADVNAKDRIGSPPLHWAVRKGQKDIVELLIEAGADMYVRKKHGGDNLLHIAASSGHKEVAEMLIVKGFDVNSRNDDESTPLYNTAFAGHAEVAKLFIEKGADVNAKNNNGTTALHYASINGRKEFAKLLIEKGADINSKSNVGTFLSPLKSEGGYTPLDFANHVWDGLEGSQILTLKIETADLLRKHGGKTKKELEAEGK